MTSRGPRAPLAVAAVTVAALLAGACAQGAGTASQAPTSSSTTTPPSPSSTVAATRTTATRTATSKPATPKPAAPTPPASTPKATTKVPAPAATAKPAAPSQPSGLPTVPRAGAEPTVRFPKNPKAVGRGANAAVATVPDSVWNRMVGYSWTRGCPVGRSSLRYVTVNFWGFDGKRSRGAIVVNRSIAPQAAAAFTRLYDLQFRIRQMRPMDSSWGRNPKGPGANDYAAMDADNTSAFNCRYVGGEEASKVYSKHAYGTAIDVNDFENPYAAPDGKVYPDDYWLHRRGPAPGVFSTSSSAAVRAFTRQGLSWGGLWKNPDYQHFDVR
jgi:D-alanyl-D-alanine carboxypeptidase-like protein